MSTATGTELLLSIDLEDVRDSLPDGERYRERVPAVTGRLLALLSEAQAKITFFVTGTVATRYPSLIAEIAAAGHELACHSHAHQPLETHTPASFAADLRRNLDALGGEGIRGFRAPVLSLTADTRWVYPLLAQHGLTYSSSVLPARNPLYGWPRFGTAPRRMAGVVEIPVSVARVLGLTLPFASGVYFRVLPFRAVRRACRRSAGAIVSYLHPYDFDPGQERFLHPGIRGNRLYNWLMYCGRAQALDRLRALLGEGYRVRRYRDHVEALPP
ncbi:MAG TPA: polysaccharide deacetylase family protein [bacterium]